MSQPNIYLRQLSLAEVELVTGGLYEGEAVDPYGIQPYSISQDYSMHLSWASMSIDPANPWDLGINPLVPDRWENWWYGRTPDGTGGAWANNGSTWSYWNSSGDLVATYVATSQNDPTVTRTVTFTHTSTTVYDFGAVDRTTTNGTSTTIYLRPVG